MDNSIKRGIKRYEKEIQKIIDKKKTFVGRDDTEARVFRTLADARLEKIRKQLDAYKKRINSLEQLEKIIGE